MPGVHLDGPQHIELRPKLDRRGAPGNALSGGAAKLRPVVLSGTEGECQEEGEANPRHGYDCKPK